MDFRRCNPRDEILIERDEKGQLLAFRYQPSVVEYFQARRNARGVMVGERLAIPVERIRKARAGTIRVSLGDALEAAGLHRSLVGALVEIFDGKVNFASDARAGDTFRLIVEEERIAGQFLRYGPIFAVEYVGSRTGTLRAFWYRAKGNKGDYYDEHGRALHGSWLRAPLRYDRVTSRFNPKRMHPILRRVVPHLGVDYAAGTGTPVWAAAPGTITFAGYKGANGNLVIIRHARGFETGYAHLQRIEKDMRRGRQVDQRQVIGYVGSTGRSTGAHLHFSLKQGANFVDPLPQMQGSGPPMAAALLPAFKRHVHAKRAELRRISLSTSRSALASTAKR